MQPWIFLWKPSIICVRNHRTVMGSLLVFTPQKCLPNQWLLSPFEEAGPLFIRPVLLVISSHFRFMFFESVFSEKRLRWSVTCVLTDEWTHSKLSAPLLLCPLQNARTALHCPAPPFSILFFINRLAALPESRWIQMVFHRTNCKIAHLAKCKIRVLSKDA